MVRARRVKRDSVENLYKKCATGDCPEDVRNKVEGTTLADKILQWFSSVFYFGGLGISTGKGTGGSTGYTPLGGTTRGVNIGSGGAIIRPTIPVEPLGPLDILPVDVQSPIETPIEVLRPEDPSVFTPAPFPTDELPNLDITVSSTQDPISDLAPSITPNRTVTDNAVIEVSPVGSAPTGAVSTSEFTNPAFTSFQVVPTTLGESSDPVSSIIHFDLGGSIVGGGPDVQYIEMEVLNTGPEEFEIEEAYTTSTPTGGGASKALKAFYHRFTKQVPTRSPAFLSQPSRLAQFEFTNPAFEDTSISLSVQDVPEAAPDADFSNLRRLSAPQYYRGPEGRVRVSRLGRLQGMRTRSGLELGAPVHYFQDISSISEGGGIELATLHGSHSGNVIDLIDSSVDTTPVLVNEGGLEDIAIEQYSDDQLLDTDSADFSNSRLIVRGTRNSVVAVPSFTEQPIKVYITDYTSDVPFTNEVLDPTSKTPYVVPNSSIVPLYPSTPVLVSYDDSEWHLYEPSLRKRRKRKRSYDFAF